MWNYFCIYNNIGNTNSNNIFNVNDFANRILYLKNYILIFEYLLLNEKFLFGLFVFLLSTIYIKNKDILIYATSISLIYILFLGNKNSHITEKCTEKYFLWRFLKIELWNVGLLDIQ